MKKWLFFTSLGFVLLGVVGVQIRQREPTTIEAVLSEQESFEYRDTEIEFIQSWNFHSEINWQEDQNWLRGYNAECVLSSRSIGEGPVPGESSVADAVTEDNLDEFKNRTFAKFSIRDLGYCVEISKTAQSVQTKIDDLDLTFVLQDSKKVDFRETQADDSHPHTVPLIKIKAVFREGILTRVQDVAPDVMLMVCGVIFGALFTGLASSKGWLGVASHHDHKRLPLDSLELEPHPHQERIS